jgi:uncharacterized protein YigE (DUF2233 family)
VNLCRRISIVLVCLSTASGRAEDLKPRSIYEGAIFSYVPIKEGVASIVTIDPKRSTLKVLVAIGGGESPLLGDYYRRSKAKVIMSGGYMSSFSPPTPLGLVKVDGTEIGRPHKTWIGTGMFCTDGRQVKIGQFDQLRSDKFTDCIQSGPLLIENGTVRYGNEGIGPGEQKLVDSVQEQAFICIDQEHKIKLGVSDPIRLDDFSHILFDKLKCQDALRLSGGASAGLQAQSDLVGNDELPLHNVIAVFQK